MWPDHGPVALNSRSMQDIRVRLPVPRLRLLAESTAWMVCLCNGHGKIVRRSSGCHLKGVVVFESFKLRR